MRSKCTYCDYETEGSVELEHSEEECIAMQGEGRKAMKAKDIIEELQSMNPDAGVFVKMGQGLHAIEEVYYSDGSSEDEPGDWPAPVYIVFLSAEPLPFPAAFPGVQVEDA